MMFRFTAIFTLLFISACIGALPEVERDPTVTYRTGDIILEEDFTSPGGWDQFESEGVNVRIERDAFRITAGEVGYVWALNHNHVHNDVVIEARTRQMSSYTNNAYGVMCRATTSGDGYYFLISGDGYYSIRHGEGAQVVDIVPWTASSAIQQGLAANRIRAVCIDDYLALYVNGVFLTETRSRAAFSGYVGFTAATRDGDVDIRFESLTVTEASF